MSAEDERPAKRLRRDDVEPTELDVDATQQSTEQQSAATVGQTSSSTTDDYELTSGARDKQQGPYARRPTSTSPRLKFDLVRD